MVCHGDKNTHLHRGVRWYAYHLCSFLTIRCFVCADRRFVQLGYWSDCVHHSKQAITQLYADLQYCLLCRFADLLVLEWLQEKYVAFRHLVRFWWSYIRYLIMFHMAKRSGIQSIFCDFTLATTSSLVIHSRFSHFMQRPVSCLS